MEESSSHVPVISLLVASSRPSALEGLLDNLERTLSTPSSCEVLLEVDEESEAMIRHARQESRRRRIALRVMTTPHGQEAGGLPAGDAALLAMRGPDAYFVMRLDDTTRFASRHWDQVLRAHIGHHADHVFHLRLNERRRREAPSLVDTQADGEPLRVYTWRWIELAGGQALAGASGDAAQAAVTFLLQSRFGVARAVPVDDIAFEHEARADGGDDTDAARDVGRRRRSRVGLQASALTLPSCQRYLRAAARLAAGVLAGPGGTVSDREAEEVVRARSLQGGDGSFSYVLSFGEWLDLLSDVPGMDAWPPLSAIRRLARREVAGHLLAEELYFPRRVLEAQGFPEPPGLDELLPDVPGELTVLQSLGELPKGRGFWVYGAARSGMRLACALADRGERLLGIVDSFARGSIFGWNILDMDAFVARRHADDGVVIASSAWRQIHESLVARGVRGIYSAHNLLAGLPPAPDELETPTRTGLIDNKTDQWRLAQSDWVVAELVELALKAFQQKPEYASARLLHALRQTCASTIDAEVVRRGLPHAVFDDAVYLKALPEGEEYPLCAVTTGPWLFLDIRPLPEPRAIAEYASEGLKISQRARRLKETCGAEYVVLVAPDKQTVYDDIAPAEIRAFETDVTAMAAVFHGAGIPLVHPVAELRAAREVRDPYYCTDTHWNDYGAYVAYLALCDQLRKLVDIHVVSEDEFRWAPRTAVMDRGTRLVPEYRETAMVAKFEDDRLVTVRSKAFWVPGGFTLFENRDKALPSAIILRDSYFSAMAPFLARSFSKLITVGNIEPAGSMVWDFVEEHRPHVVLNQAVERHFRDWRTMDYRSQELGRAPFLPPIQSHADVFDTVVTVIRDHFKTDGPIDRDTSAFDIDGWDSLEHFVLLRRLEGAVGFFNFDERIRYGSATVGELADNIAAAMREQEGAGDRPNSDAGP